MGKESSSRCTGAAPAIVFLRSQKLSKKATWTKVPSFVLILSLDNYEKDLKLSLIHIYKDVDNYLDEIDD